MKQWFVVYTQPRAESRALQHLENQGFECFLPKFERLRRHARRTEVVLAPLFPRYLFTAFDRATTRWRSINGSRGVVALLTNDADPIPIRCKIVEALLADADESHVTTLAALDIFSRAEIDVQLPRLNDAATGLEGAPERLRTDADGGHRPQPGDHYPSRVAISHHSPLPPGLATGPPYAAVRTTLLLYPPNPAELFRATRTWASRTESRTASMEHGSNTFRRCQVGMIF